MPNTKAIWRTPLTLEAIHNINKNDAAMRIGLEFTEIGDDYIRAKLPVDERTMQPFGLLHGGISCVVSETMGSVASNFCVDQSTHYCVGIEINASHLRSARSGWVYAETRPLRVGRQAQFWETRISDDKDQLVCVSRLTTAVVAR